MELSTKNARYGIALLKYAGIISIWNPHFALHIGVYRRYRLWGYQEITAWEVAYKVGGGPLFLLVVDD